MYWKLCGILTGIIICICLIAGFQYNTIAEGFTPVSSTPVSSTPVSSTPVSSTPVPSTPVSSTPVSSTPVSSTPVPSTPVSSTPVSSTPVSSTPVSSTPVSSTPVSFTPVPSTPVPSKSSKNHSLSPDELKLLDTTAIYYEPGTYMYRGTGYEPTYSEVMLSNSEKMSPYPITSAPYLSGGFCNYFKSSPTEKEKKCNELNSETCASTECCILLSGKKCVAGNEYGAENKANYSDFLLGNVDYYYYKGKCYGNCPV